MRSNAAVNQSNFNASKTAQITVILPPLAEQERIVVEVERRLSIIDELKSQLEADLSRAERLRQSILKRAFEGKLVPQDPNDEPASMLLERIRANRNTSVKAKSIPSRRAKKRARTVKAEI
jgi:type I restriction enzyme S subunit